MTFKVPLENTCLEILSLTADWVNYEQDQGTPKPYTESKKYTLLYR